MPRRSAGEVEVMLSDRQLILLFVIGVLLLGVFFAMGFLVGKRMAATPAAGPAGEPQPGKALSKMAESLSKPLPSSGAVAESPSSERVASPSSTLSAEGAAAVTEPPRGTVFLQVSAQDLANARVFAEALSQRGFRSIIAPGPTRDVFRVLVGPLEGPEQVAKTREELKAAGFDSIVRKY
ncbi:MAG: SPOR domain-containing protein [Bryobacteraceae bacterium]|nr:SPOR domain-containing protein [Bryobacteraceae bacterium]